MISEGERIKELRKMLGLTLEEFAAPLGVKKATMSKIEHGNNNVTTQMRVAICKEYRVNEEWLKTGQGEMKKITLDDELEKIVKKYNLDDSEAKLVKNFVELDSGIRKRILAYVDALTRLNKDPEDK